MCQIIEEMKEEVREKARKEALAEGRREGQQSFATELRKLGVSEDLLARAAAAAQSN